MNHGFVAPIIELYTTWHNPLPVDQRVDLYHGNERRPTRYLFKAGQEVQLPSRFDSAIQVVQCMDEKCRATPPHFCLKPGDHQGIIIGGMAPQLQRRGAKLTLDPNLDPNLAEKKTQEAEIAAQVLAKRNAEQAMMIAAAKKLEAEDAAKAAARAAEIANEANKKK